MQTVGASVGEGELRIDGRLAERLARHLEVADEVVVLGSPRRRLDDLEVVRRVVGLDVRVDGVLDAETVELGLRETTPDGGLVDLARVLRRTVDADDILDENIHRVEVLVVLAVQRERLLIESLLRRDRGNLVDVEALDLVDVAHDLALVGADRGEEEELLEVAVVAERGRLEDDLLEELDELSREVGREEGLDGDGDILGVGRLGNGSRDDLGDGAALVDDPRRGEGHVDSPDLRADACGRSRS